MSYGYVYVTTNLLNGKVYIGQHKAQKHDTRYFGSGTYIRTAIETEGVENFKNEILEWCETKEIQYEREIYWIEQYNSTDNDIGYNIMLGGAAGDCTVGMTPKDYKRYCENLSGKNNPMYRSGELGTHPKGMLGKNHTDETKKVLSEKNKGENNQFYGKSWDDFGGHPKGMLGKKHPKSTRWRHQVVVDMTFPNGDQFHFDSVSKAIRETGVSSAIIYSIIEKGEPYKAKKKRNEHLNGLIVVKKRIPS